MPPSARLTVVALAALALAGCQKADDAAFGAKVRTYLLAHPEVIEEAVAKLQDNKRIEAANKAVTGLRNERKALEADNRDFVANPNGRITVVEFFDYRCGYCKSSAPEVLKLIEQNPDLRFVFKELPIFGGESDLAAKVALTAAGKARGLDIYRAFMSEKALDEAAIDRHLASLGLNPSAIKAAGNSTAITKQIADSHALAQKLGIEGTPAFVIGDTLIPGADMPALRAAIARAKAG